MSGPPLMTVYYLHGFASGAKSTKGGYFGDRLLERGIALRCPDFNEPDFATLTLTRMLDRLESHLSRPTRQGAVLIRPSVGGTRAAPAAAKFPRPGKQPGLLAQAVMFAKPGHHR